MRALAVAAMLAIAITTCAHAQNSTSYGSQLGVLPSDTRVSLGLDPAGLFGPIALDANHYQMMNCAVGCGGGGGGGSNASVGTFGSTLTSLTQMGVLDSAGHSQALGPNYAMPVAAPAQQTMQAPVPVTVPASASTTVWITSTAARTLKILPVANGTCSMDDSGNTATASSLPIPSGYVYNLAEPPPKYNVSVFCSTAGTVVVSQGN